MADSLWSHIIWNKLGNDYKSYNIHNESFRKSCGLVIDYFKTLTTVEIDKLLTDLTCIGIEDDTLYYDQFYSTFYVSLDYQNENKKENKNFNIVLPDSHLLSFVLQIALKFHNEFDHDIFNFINRIRKDYKEKFINEKRLDRYDKMNNHSDSYDEQYVIEKEQYDSQKKYIIGHNQFLLLDSNGISDCHDRYPDNVIL